MRLKAIPLEIPEERRRGSFGKAVLCLNGILNPEHTPISIRLFIDNPDADKSTPFPGDPSFAGKAEIMSRPRFPESVRKGLLPWTDPSTPHIEPDPAINLRFDVSELLRRSAGRITLTVVVTDMANARQPDELLEFDGIELRFDD